MDLFLILNEIAAAMIGTSDSVETVSNQPVAIPVWLQIVMSLASVSVALVALVVAICNNNRTERYMKKNSRAYLSIEIAILRVREQDDNGVIAITLKNFGLTPAKNLRISEKCKMIDYNGRNTFSHDNNFEPAPGLVGAGGSITKYPDFPNATEVEINQSLQEKKLKFVISFTIRYDDIFDQTYSEDFLLTTSEEVLGLSTKSDGKVFFEYPLVGEDGFTGN